jgi:hypothetical protein
MENWTKSSSGQHDRCLNGRADRSIMGIMTENIMDMDMRTTIIRKENTFF